MREEYIAIKCERCSKEIKRMVASMMVWNGNPRYCDDCNEEVQKLPN